ncbi:MAG: nucleotidyl transferase AbiEii/AbiGii toxin family protein [Hyphomicrobiales bacterium]|nr:nucleotidyl transferase AbiEii/AbiGii toxin family protein [Hyphomicrobiales bacterium]MCY4038252.1 nucleotidyl transferase AbiEii/AbiGii toxin family protein [Hyphomicrobiales bacterium]
MIPENFIQEWRENARWKNLVQVEQDLIISRALVDLYNEPHVRESLAFRGGTALNKLFLKPPARYSEDIDLVQKRIEPIGQTIDAIREILKPWLGDPRWKIARNTTLIYKYEAINKLPARLKIEINTTEHFRMLPLRTEEFSVQSGWWNGNAKLVTYEIDELMATKLRALYQRRKGRDLFDLWYVAKNKMINLDRVFEIFAEYCAKDDLHFTKDEFLSNLESKRSHPDFQLDIHALLPADSKWNFDEAHQFVVDNVVSKLP